MTCSRPRSRRSSRTPAARWPWTGRTWSPSPGPRRQGRRLRRPRGLLGPPQEQPAAQPGRAVLRLLPVRRDHDARGERARRPRARPPRHAVVVPARPGPRLRPRADRDARQGSRSATSSTTPATPTATRAWAMPLRAAGAQLVQDLHPHDRGPKGTHDGAIIANGNLYCPDTAHAAGTRAARPHRHQGASRRPRPQDRRARPLQARPHHRRRRRRLPPRQCPAAMGKIRCPLRPASMTLDRDRPEILHPPEHPQACCTQQTITVPPDVHAKTAQKHDYPSAACAAPTPAAPAPNAASPPPRTPPPTTSAAAGAASWAWHP